MLLGAVFFEPIARGDSSCGSRSLEKNSSVQKNQKHSHRRQIPPVDGHAPPPPAKMHFVVLILRCKRKFVQFLQFYTVELLVGVRPL